MNNDQHKPWWVVVERNDQNLNKGQKFYAGFDSQQDAESIADKKQKTADTEARKHKREGRNVSYKYSVIERPR